MSVFIIVAAVFLTINILFLIGSLIYTLKSKPVMEFMSATRQSIAQSILAAHEHRISGQPQVALFETFVRVSGGVLPYNENLNLTDKKPMQEDTQQEAIKQK